MCRIYAHKIYAQNIRAIKCMRRIYAHKNVCAEYIRAQKFMRRIYVHTMYAHNIRA